MSENLKQVFRPKARLMVSLGEQLIKNHTLALFELAKYTTLDSTGHCNTRIFTLNHRVFIKWL